MRRWNRTTVEWEMSRGVGIATNIPITDWPRPEEKRFYTMHELTIFSTPNSRQAVLVIDIRQYALGPTDQHETVVQRLKEVGQGRRNLLVLRNDRSVKYESLFQLFPDELFCEAALAVGRDVIELFGIQNAKDIRFAHFQITQQTFVRSERKWIDYASWLRRKLGLLQVYDVETATLNPGFVKAESIA